MNRIIKKAYALATVCAILLAFVTIIVPVEAATFGSLTIRKFDVKDYANLSEASGASSDQAKLPADATSMAGVEFKVSKLLVGSGKVNVTPTTPVDTRFTPKIGTTNSDGEVVFDNLPQGYYLVTETMIDGYDSPEEGELIVAIPTQINVDGSEVFNYDVVIYPKNKKIQVEKTLESTRQVIGIGDIVTWKVKYPISTGLKKEEIIGGSATTSYGKNFYITDEMDSRLDYVTGSAKMNYYDEAGTNLNLNLVEGTDYVLNYDESTHILKVSFTDNVGTKKVADAKVSTIELMLDTAVNASAIGTVEAMTNNARIKFTNHSGDPFEHEVFPPGTSPEDSRVPKVYLGTIDILKVDSEDENITLAGATFALAKSEKQAKNGQFERTDIVTNSHGEANISAIGEGTYYLVETKAPEGYKLSTKPIEVTVINDSSMRNINVTIANEKDKAATTTTPGPGTPKPTSRPGTSSGVAQGSATLKGMSAKTGDVTQILGIVILAVASLGMIGYLGEKRKNKCNKDMQ